MFLSNKKLITLLFIVIFKQPINAQLERIVLVRSESKSLRSSTLSSKIFSRSALRKYLPELTIATLYLCASMPFMPQDVSTTLDLGASSIWIIDSSIAWMHERRQPEDSAALLV